MYKYNARVTYSQVDSNLNLTYYSLVNYMQDCSCFHSDDMGVGVRYLAPRMRGWFVTTYEIHINRMPTNMENITIKRYWIWRIISFSDFLVIITHNTFLTWT